MAFLFLGLTGILYFENFYALWPDNKGVRAESVLPNTYTQNVFKTGFIYKLKYHNGTSGPRLYRIDKCPNKENFTHLKMFIVANLKTKGV